MNLLRDPLFTFEHSRMTIPVLALATLLCFSSYESAHAGKAEVASKALSILAGIVMDIGAKVGTDVLTGKVARSGPLPGEAAPPGRVAPGLDYPKAAPPQRISGVQIQLAWQYMDGPYSGTLVLQDAGGTLEVLTPQQYVIHQVVTAQAAPPPYRGDILLVGSNPTTVAGQLSPSYFYSPDRFRVTRSHGQWVIADICDARGQCAPVSIVAASTY
jgi:hypothetical protein